MLKSYKLFILEKLDKTKSGSEYALQLKDDILSKSDKWKEVGEDDPGCSDYNECGSEWRWCLEYKLDDNIVLSVVCFLNYSVRYYLGDTSEDPVDHRHIGKYTEYYDKFESIYKDKSDYGRMMSICNYLLPSYKNKPSDDMKKFLKEVFIDLTDLCDREPLFLWGYVDRIGSEISRLSDIPKHIDDKLSLVIEWKCKEEQFDELVNEYDLNKSKLSFELDCDEDDIEKYITLEWGYDKFSQTLNVFRLIIDSKLFD